MLCVCVCVCVCRKIDNKVMQVKGEIYGEVDTFAFRFYWIIIRTMRDNISDVESTMDVWKWKMCVCVCVCVCVISSKRPKTKSAF